MGDKILDQERMKIMSIEKKSLISALKTTRKANVASGPASHDGITKTEVLKKASGKRAVFKYRKT